MRPRYTIPLLLAALLMGTVLAVPAQSGVFDQFIETGPPTLTQVARMIDHIQSQIANQGTVVVKQADIWSQARMTKFRREFEDQMAAELTNFQVKLAGRVARTDTASFQSGTSIGGVLNPLKANANGDLPNVISSSSDLSAALGNVQGLSTSSTTDPATKTTTTTFNGLPGTITNTSPSTAATFGLLPAPTGATTTNAFFTNTPIGLEPNIQNAEKADYITNLARVRRNNLGDDNTDSAGYAMYMMRVPVSLQPGDKTVKGHGAIVSLTMKHDFGPRFLPSTYRNLVINDVVDLLGPIVLELIRSGDAAKHHKAVQDYLDLKNQRTPEAKSLALGELNRKTNEAQANARKIEQDLEINSSFFPVSRTDSRSYAIAPSDVRRVFLGENLLKLAFAVQSGINMGRAKSPQTLGVRTLDVRSYLRQELEVAYDLMDGHTRQDRLAILMEADYMERLVDDFLERKFDASKIDQVNDDDAKSNEFYNLFEAFVNKLPGNLRNQPIGVLCWAVALDAGLLNRHLRYDMTQTKGEDYHCPDDIDGMQFYLPLPTPDIDTAFQNYIRARWPMIVFGLEPVTDQQNIEEAFSRKRDLAVAIAFALSTGRLSFRQAMQYQRQLQYEAQTIDLNQTIAAFAHGNDTFGWRFSPRFQLPPEESNPRALFNLVYRGGPGPKYQPNNSKIEPGMRETLAVVVMPSFIRGMRLDIANDWYRLSDPDERKLKTAKAVELGRMINEARDALDQACACGRYRTEDTDRLRAKLHMLEAQLPLQTQFVKVPYENTLGGFALFTQGTTALVPELSGYEGIQYYDATKPNDIVVFGKHFSLYEMSVLVGGNTLFREGQVVKTQTNTGVQNAVVSGFVLRDPTTGQLVVQSSTDASKFDVLANSANIGSYDILSREVIRIHMPAGLHTSIRDDKTEVVEIQVATPNGISNRLQIPVKPSGSAAGIASGIAYAFLDTSVAMQFKSTDGKKATGALGPASPDATIRLKASSSKNLAKSVTLTISVNLPPDAAATSALPNIPIKGVALVDSDTYVVTNKQLSDFNTALFTALNAAGQAPTKALSTYSTGPVLVTPEGTGQPSSYTAGGLTIPTQLISVATTPSAMNRERPDSLQGPRYSARPGDQDLTVGANESDDRDSFVVRTSLARRTAASASFADPAVDALENRLASIEKKQTEAAAKLETLISSGAVDLPKLPSQSFQHLVVTPTGPTINVSVPVSNYPQQRRSLFSFLHPGQAQGTAPPKVQGPLTERLLGRP